VNAVGHVEIVLLRARNADQALGLVVIRRDVVVVDRPVFAESLRGFSLEIHRAMTETRTPPGVGAAAHGAQPRPMEFRVRGVLVFAGVGVELSGVFVDLPQAVVFTRTPAPSKR